MMKLLEIWQDAKLELAPIVEQLMSDVAEGTA